MNLGDVAVDSVLYVPFSTYNSSGASVTISGFVVGDIKIYKDGGTTQRSSTNGYTLLDTDGIDFAGITGIHGFSINLADNTDAGFYAAGSSYFIVVNAITVDGQTVNFVYHFTIQKANVLRPTTAGRKLEVDTSERARCDVRAWLGTAAATPTVAGVPEVDVTHLNGSASAAVLHALAAGTMVAGTVSATGLTPTTTQFDADDITEATADHYKGRLVIFTSGAMFGQAGRIDAYSLVSGRGRFTLTTLTESPATGVTFVIV